MPREIRTEIWLSSDPKNRKRPVLRRYICGYKGCKGKRFYLYSEVQRHLCLHNCSRCGTRFEIGKHKCPIQVGAGPSNLTNGEIQTVDVGAFKITKMAHDQTAVTYLAEIADTIETFTDAFKSADTDLHALLENQIDKHVGLNVSISFYTTLEKVSDKTLLERKFIGPYILYLHKSFIQDKLREARHYLELSLSLYEANGSGFRLKTIHSMELRMLPYKPDLQRFGGSYVPLPKELKRKGIISIKAETRCFMFCILLAVFKDKIKLPEFPQYDFKWEDLTFNHRKRLLRMYENPKTYLKFLNHVMKSNQINFLAFENEVAAQDFPKLLERKTISEPTQNTRELVYTSEFGNQSIHSYYMAIADYDNKLKFERFHTSEYALEDFVSTFITKVNELHEKVQNTFIPYEKSNELAEKLAKAERCEICWAQFKGPSDKVTHHHHSSKRLDLYPYTITCNLWGLLPEYSAKFEVITQETVLTMNFDKKCRIIDRKRFVEEVPYELRWSLKAANHYAKFTRLQYLPSAIDFLLTYPGVKLPANYDEKLVGWKDVNLQSYEISAIRQFYDVPTFDTEIGDVMQRYIHDYLRSSVLILADYFWYLDRFMITNFGISCLFYPSLASYSFDCAMASTRASFEYLRCPEMISFAKKGLHGPLEMSNLKFARSNSERFASKNVTDRNRRYPVIGSVIVSGSDCSSTTSPV
ncbi:hypothetical protein Fcan01_17848 [Folsomia candida]|uniref:Uncharacterized protein n=1 Tax=Folsomia candida TaxID=158441 RepID=A0A226DTX7_FOLCA|nr:hypothetical protein Fcan01_17848 [Folsomia candida]